MQPARRRHWRSRTGSVRGVMISIALLLVIVISASMKIHETVEDIHSSDHTFECTKCGHQFRIPPEDRECLQSDLGPYGVTKSCPKCKQKAGKCTIVCPACYKHILRPIDNQCPRCHKDIIKTLDEKTAKVIGRTRSKEGSRPPSTEQLLGVSPTQAARLDAISMDAISLFRECQDLLGPGGYKLSEDADELAWSLGYVMAGYEAMYEATGNEALLRTLLDYIQQVQARRSDHLAQPDEVRGGLIPAWVSTAHSGGKSYAWLAHAGMITYPMARCAAVLRRDPGLHARHEAQADELVAQVEQTIRAFEDDYRPGPGPDEGRYACRVLGTDLPFSQQNALGRTLVAMYQATGDVWYRHRAESLARYFIARWRIRDGKAEWDYWTEQNAQIEDLSNAAINVQFAWDCYEAGIAFDEQSIRQLVSTFNSLIRPGGFAERIDGSGQSNQFANSAGLWCQLASVDPQIRQVLADYLGGHYQEDLPLSMLTAAYLVQTQPQVTTEPDPMSGPGGASSQKP